MKCHILSTLRTRTVLLCAGTGSLMALFSMYLITPSNEWSKYMLIFNMNIESSVTATHSLSSCSELFNELSFSANSTNSYINCCNDTELRSNNTGYVCNLTMQHRLMEILNIVKMPGINCNALFNGTPLAAAKMNTTGRQDDIPIKDIDYLNLTQDCENFQTTRGYIMSSLTQEEEDFPLAFSMVVYKDAEMVERLLRAIYRPQNYYCIHVDLKASDNFINATSAIADCFPNVFIASRRIIVKWSWYSVLEAEIVCMNELWKYSKWKYFINLTGQELPLKTNYELVKILTAYRGASDVMTNYKCIGRHNWRWRGYPVPFGLVKSVGSVHITANRDFVDYIVNNETGAAILNWTKLLAIPDEIFFTLLNANPKLGIKGTYTGHQDSCDKRLFMTRYKMWYNAPCAGRKVRDICILSTGDLPRLFAAKQLFANKFFLNDDRTVVGCLEEKIFNDTREEYIGRKTFDTDYYSKLDFVINQLT
uniref:Protein xylosyltransferase n=1 Tax=Arion vulgaris TaxID=1028688 RepID=A0A0B7BRI2_9EUPU